MATTIEEYLQQRDEILNNEAGRYLGAQLALTEKEEKVNALLMAAKNAEIQAGFNDPASFIASKHLFEVLGQVEESKVYKLIRTLPKGGILHAHDTALLSIDKIVQKFTYRDNLWIAGDVFKAQPQLTFSREKPTTEGNWRPISQARAERDPVEFDTALRSHFTLYCRDPVSTYRDIDTVWNKFMSLFEAVDPIVLYEEVWSDYYYETLKECVEDGVQYLEFRGLLPPVYTLDGRKLSQLEVCELYVKTYARFQADYPNAITSRFIFAPLRFVDIPMLQQHINTYKALKAAYPDFIVGFDLVGQEDKGFPHKEFVQLLLDNRKEIPYIFHAAETNWNGTSSDENIIDAILLGTRRIGHGFGAVKHPKVLEEVKKRDICIELNPLSNQVLKLVEDLRNHPAAILFSDNYPVVVSCDDPSFWEATPLSHDFYFAFMAIASANADLRFIKQLAINSIKYSCLTAVERETVMQQWTLEWDKAMDEILEN